VHDHQFVFLSWVAFSTGLCICNFFVFLLAQQRVFLHVHEDVRGNVVELLVLDLAKLVGIVLTPF